MKKIVVTGATSFIGVHLIQALLKKNCFIYAVVRPKSININRLPKSFKLKVIELDINVYKRQATNSEKSILGKHIVSFREKQSL